MGIVVQKYGGTSVANAARMRAVAERIVRSQQEGQCVVAVVSAMGDTTDDLIQLARSVSERPEGREMDLLLSTGETISCTLLAMALRSMGHPATALTGAQAGIYTDAVHSKARIVSIDPQRVQRELERGQIVIIAGFQGITDDFDITTLGRGGSDTTAVALAIALQGEVCEIYTDVDGVYTADPRVVPEARKLEEVSYEEMLEMAQHGARVMHPRAVELGEVYQMPIIVRSSFNGNPGTLIRGGEGMENRKKVRGVTCDTDIAKITIQGVPDRPGLASAIFTPLAEAHINVDTIVQNIGYVGSTDLSFTVNSADLAQAGEVVQRLIPQIGAAGIAATDDLAKVSIVGTGIQSHPGYAARMFAALAEANVNIGVISTSEIRITCLIERSRANDAVRALHRAFELEQADSEELAGS